MTTPTMQGATAQLPIKLSGRYGRLTVVTPMPGLQPSDISAENTADHRLILQGEPRGVQVGVNEETEVAEI
jgi:hypothetical protein